MTKLAVLPLLLAATSPGIDDQAIDIDIAKHVTILTAHAEGAQIYLCKVGDDGRLRWSFREPIASLMVDGRTVGRHFAGPRWALDDGSLIQGKAVSTAPGATDYDIPILKLAVTDISGTGALRSAAMVYRVRTHGGVLTGACTTPGTIRSVAYSADYVFAK